MSLCQICGEAEATIKTIDIVNNVKSERHICEGCYKKQGFSQPFSVPNITDFVKLTPTSAEIDLQGLGELVQGLQKGRPTEEETIDIVCDRCGTSLEEFRKRGVVGCAHDYELFHDEIDKLATRLHGASEHAGKVPREVEAERARELDFECHRGSLSAGRTGPRRRAAYEPVSTYWERSDGGNRERKSED